MPQDTSQALQSNHTNLAHDHDYNADSNDWLACKQKDRLGVHWAFPGSRVTRPAKRKYRRWHDSFMMERTIPPVRISRSCDTRQLLPVQYDEKEEPTCFQNPSLAFCFCRGGLAAWGTTDS